METINIAGVSCRVDKLATLTYEQLFRNAQGHPKWKGVKNRDEKIHQELLDNGFKPSSTNRGSSKVDKSNDGRENVRKRTSRKGRGNRKSS